MSEVVTDVRREGMSLFSVPGILGAAVRSGVKPSGDLDLALIRCEEPMSAAGVFTTNSAAAAPVHISRERLRITPRVRAIVINSGNANALTGARGVTDAKAMLERTEARCGGPAVVLSTGVIGVPLPIEKVLQGIDDAADRLTMDATGGGKDVARAMLTTDKVEKTAAVTTATRPAYTVGGVAKGSGMIHPNMATMLAVIATDAPIHAGSLRTMLRNAVDRSFHEISVDGDVSTNDAVLLLAKHPGEGPLLSYDAETAVTRAIFDVAGQLARRIVEDGEGAHRVLRIDVTGAASRADAKRVAVEIARSSLVKTALAGGDPNWGRLLSAAGAAGGAFSPETARLTIGDHLVFADGEPRSLDARALDRVFANPEVHVRLDLGRGRHSGRMLTTDLTHDYVEINSAYTT